MAWILAFPIVKVIAVTGIAILLIGLPDANANSRFTIDNQSYDRVSIDIYGGADSVCKVPEKTKSVGAGKSNSFGCTGGGNQQCKLDIVVRNDKGTTRVCDPPSAKYPLCQEMTRVPNKATVTLDGAGDCKITTE